MKVTGVSIKDFGCIAFRVIEIGPDGVEIKGPCGTGKTTIANAIAIRPWCDPEVEIRDPIVVPIKEAAAEARLGKPSHLTIVIPAEESEGR